jgi:hypothetical protein
MQFQKAKLNCKLVIIKFELYIDNFTELAIGTYWLLTILPKEAL